MSIRIPDENKFLHGLVSYLENSGDKKIVELIRNRKCQIITNRVDPFSNIHFITIYFHMPINNIALIKPKMKKKLLGACKKIMPYGNYYNVSDVAFTPILEEIPMEESLMDELSATSKTLHKK